MNVARKLYWTLLHTRIYRLWILTACIILCLLSGWLYFWYFPTRRAIERLMYQEVAASSKK